MMRSIAGVVAGLVAWIAVAQLGNMALRAVLPDYRAGAEPAMTFTLPMMFARLFLGAASSIGGAVTAWIVRGDGARRGSSAWRWSRSSSRCMSGCGRSSRSGITRPSWFRCCRSPFWARRCSPAIDAEIYRSSAGIAPRRIAGATGG